MSGPQPVRGGSPVAGFPVGVLCIETRHALLPGNVQHAGSFDHPVVYEVVPVENPWDLMQGKPELLGPILAGAQRLERLGVRAVVGACGSFAYYQGEVARQMRVPTFLSIMTQVPFLQQSLGAGRKLALICAALSTMNPRVFEACGIRDTSNLAFFEMAGSPEFDRMLRAEDPMDPQRLCDEVLAVGRRALSEEPETSAFLLQCSDLPPFGRALQAATGLPVFDMTLLVRWLQSAAAYPAFA